MAKIHGRPVIAATLVGYLGLGLGAVEVSTPSGPPANLESGVFRSVVDTMWRRSPTFRRQCQRVGMERRLVVTLLVDTSRVKASVRATTEMSRKNGTLTLARVVIFSPADTVELVAHEIEHVIEQLDGVALRDRSSASTTHAADVSYESDRAAHVGRLVAREVSEYGGRVVMRIPQREAPGGALDPASASISANGRFIAFTSSARLVAADADDDVDLYVVDVRSGDTTLESPEAGWAAHYRRFVFPRTSGDGRFIVFQAVAPSGPAPSAWQVLVLDRHHGSARVVSVDASGRPANGHCTQATISADGTTVVFESVATNLVASGDANGNISDVYMTRLPDGPVSRVSVRNDGSQPTAGQSVTPAVSADGRTVAFMSAADLACPDAATCAAPLRRGVQVAGIYLRDTTANITSPVSGSSDGRVANGPSAWPAISGDGRYVAFVSEASNLVRGDGNREADIFLRDTSTGTIEIVSRRPDGRAANGASRLPAISTDGRTVAFQSLASDLICAKHCDPRDHDINLLWDVFVYDRMSGVMVRASADETGEWMETSRAPSIDSSGSVLVFTSRHPIAADDVNNDDDLLVWRGTGATLTTRRLPY